MVNFKFIKYIWKTNEVYFYSINVCYFLSYLSNAISYKNKTNNSFFLIFMYVIMLYKIGHSDFKELFRNFIF